MKRMMLYFGSFNPIHKGHIALAEYAVEQDLCDQVALIVSPQSPYKQGAELAPEFMRFEMAEIACKASKYPEQIVASAVEFVLPKPSYTIETLRFLEEQCGGQMHFSLLMGADQIDALDGWKEYEKILEYPIYVYPRRDAHPTQHLNRITLLDGAPMQEFAATQARRSIGLGEDTTPILHPDVAAYIRSKELWTPEARIDALTTQIETDPSCAELYLERGRLHYRFSAWGAALNDFNRVLQIEPHHAEAQQFADMVQEILEFRYTDIYNP